MDIKSFIRVLKKFENYNCKGFGLVEEVVMVM